MKILKQFGVIFGVCWVSLVIEHYLPFSFPASVIGMILTPAGTKKNAIFPNKKSAFSCTCSIFKNPVSKQSNNKIIPITLAGK